MELTKEVAETDEELVERIKAEFPTQFAEFNRLKKQKAKWETEKFDDHLHWLQMEMVYGRKWIWDSTATCADLDEFSSDERKIISRVASNYYEEMEKRLWTGNNEYPDRKELTRLVKEAGVFADENDGIFWSTYMYGVHPGTRVFAVINSWRELWKDWQADFPQELQY